MESHCLENGDLLVSRTIHVLLCMLRETCSEEKLSSKSLRRLYPDPVKGMDGDENAESIRSDWKEFIEPDLQLENRTALETVMTDLEAVQRFEVEPEDGEEDEDGLYAIQIPPDHLEAWANTLTQARVILTEEYQLAEGISLADLEPAVERMLASQQCEIYAYLLELIVERLTESL
ncbi:MAG: DUF2017 family protein [Verrucomicrobiota bacterium]